MTENEPNWEIAGRDGDSGTVGGIVAVVVLLILGLYWVTSPRRDSELAATAGLTTGRSVAHNQLSESATVPPSHRKPSHPKTASFSALAAERDAASFAKNKLQEQSNVQTSHPALRHRCSSCANERTLARVARGWHPVSGHGFIGRD